MKLFKNFALVVVSLIGDLWLGLGIKQEVYDNRTNVETKIGYFFFNSMAALVALAAVAWLCIRIY
ncbi:hypothetical protein D3C73_1475690 [compost metagenome]